MPKFAYFCCILATFFSSPSADGFPNKFAQIYQETRFMDHLLLVFGLTNLGSAIHDLVVANRDINTIENFLKETLENTKEPNKDEDVATFKSKELIRRIRLNQILSVLLVPTTIFAVLFAITDRYDEIIDKIKLQQRNLYKFKFDNGDHADEKKFSITNLNIPRIFLFASFIANQLRHIFLRRYDPIVEFDSFLSQELDKEFQILKQAFPYDISSKALDNDTLRSFINTLFYYTRSDKTPKSMKDLITKFMIDLNNSTQTWDSIYRLIKDFNCGYRTKEEKFTLLLAKYQLFTVFRSMSQRTRNQQIAGSTALMEMPENNTNYVVISQSTEAPTAINDQLAQPAIYVNSSPENQQKIITSTANDCPVYNMEQQQNFIPNYSYTPQRVAYQRA